MDKAPYFFFGDSAYKMLKCFYIFSVLADKKWWIRCFYTNRNIISFFCYSKACHRYTEFWEKCRKEFFHKQKFINVLYRISIKDKVWDFCWRREGDLPLSCVVPTIVGHSHSGVWLASEMLAHVLISLDLYICRYGGEREIRTPGIFRYAPFPRVCTRPLCDLSKIIDTKKQMAQTRGNRSSVSCDTHPCLGWGRLPLCVLSQNLTIYIRFYLFFK